jgi:anion-transporting  ArsA/GET3 family ATPase
LSEVADPKPLELFKNRSVVVCVGSGGVGKTSVAATLSVAAARQGLAVLALTVDPSRRLAECLGVDRESGQRQALRPEHQRQLGIETGSLHVQLLDAARTWDELVSRLAADDVRERILAHPLYRSLKEHLAGAQEYMAMEKLLSLMTEGGQDLIVLDTPPSRHALDFLTAPERLIDAMETPVTRAFARVVDGSRRFGMDLAARGVASLIRTMSKLTGAGMLEQLASLIAELNHLFGGFRERAERISAAFRDESFAYVLVIRPDRRAVDDAKYFVAALEEQQMRVDALVINRVQPRLDVDLAQLKPQLEALLGSELCAPVVAAAKAQQRMVEVEQDVIRGLDASSGLGGALRIELADTLGGVEGLVQLSRLADELLGSDDGSAG